MSICGTVCLSANKRATKNKPYIVDAVIGNGKMLGTLSEDGELHRLWWPQIGFPNHINEFVFGVFVEDVSYDISWLNGGKWTHNQFYIPDTNVLITKSMCHALPITFEVSDFCLPEGDTLVRSVEISSLTGSALTVQLFVCASFAIGESTRYNAVSWDKKNDALVYWRREYAFAMGGGRDCTAFEAGRCRESITTKSPAAHTGDKNESDDQQRQQPPTSSGGHQNPYHVDIVLNGNEIAMEMSGAMSWTIVTNKEETVNVPLYICAGDSIESALAELNATKAVGASKLKETTVSYWHEYVRASRPLKTTNEDIKKLFKRSALTFKLLTDKTSGAIIAAPELDEDYRMCGGYSYCWGRDAAYITSAIDKVGYHDQVNKFYDWTLKAQSEDGSWHQRHFMDGRLAPQWGFQVDETGSVIWGMWEHYVVLSAANEEPQKFADKMWNAVQKGAEFLVKFVDPETRLPLASKDLWEERYGEHIYSAAAVCGGLKAAAEFGKLFSRNLEAREWAKAGASIRDGIMVNGWSEERGHFLRVIKMQVDKAFYTEAKDKSVRAFTTTTDKGYEKYFVSVEGVIDVSLLGLSIPFDVIKVDDRRMKLTAEEIRKKLTVPTVGGLRRYENDNYIGGNPWILTTLWMALYDAQQGSVDLAKEALQWALDHQTKAGLLPEQIDQTTGKTAWVVPLTWSHAMYVLLVVALDDAGAI